LDSILVVNETVDVLKREEKSVIVKMDYENDYDSVDWNFLLYDEKTRFQYYMDKSLLGIIHNLNFGIWYLQRNTNLREDLDKVTK